MRVFREIAEVVDLLVLPMLGRAVIFVVVPVALIALIAPRACSCSTKAAAYRIAMKSDLRQLATAQERYFAEHRRYTSDLSQLSFRASTGVAIDSIAVTSTGFTAHASYPGGTSERCHVEYGPTWNEASRASCDLDALRYGPKRKLP